MNSGDRSFMRDDLLVVFAKLLNSCQEGGMLIREEIPDEILALEVGKALSGLLGRFVLGGVGRKGARSDVVDNKEITVTREPFKVIVVSVDMVTSDDVTKLIWYFHIGSPHVALSDCFGDLTVLTMWI